VSSENPESSSDYLFECINQRAMTIGRQSLQIFESDSADKNDVADKNYVSRVCKGKEAAKNRKRDQMFKMSVGSSSSVASEAAIAYNISNT
jgi:hypothetical protein